MRGRDASGAGSRSRTHGLLITSQLLYRLSYTGKETPCGVGPAVLPQAGIGPDMLSVRQSHHYAGVACSQRLLP